MSETIIGVLQESLESSEQEREKLLDELVKIEKNSSNLRGIIYTPYYGDPDDPIPFEFSNPDEFLEVWDQTDKALGNTILMVMPPSSFETPPEPEKSAPPTQPINIITAQPKESQPSGTSKGFWSGIWDYRRDKLKLNGRKAERPTITTGQVIYDPKDVVYQLIPSLNEIKELYFEYLARHQSYLTASIRLCQLGHIRLQEEMSKYFNVVHPFCIASVKFQQRQIRQDKLGQMDNVTRIAVAAEEAKAMSTPYIPPELRALAAAMAEGKEFSMRGFKTPSAKQLAEDAKKRRGR